MNRWHKILRVVVAGMMVTACACRAQVKEEAERWVVTPSASVQIRSGSGASENFHGQKPLVVRRGTGPDDTSSWLLRYDLSGVPQEASQYAGIWIKGNATGEGSSPSFSVCRVADDWDPKTVTWASAPSRAERVNEVTIRQDINGPVALPVTRAIGEGLKSDRVSFLVEMRSAPGFSRAMEFDGQAPLVVYKVVEPRFDLSALLHPVWKADVIACETVAPIARDGNPAEGNLALAPSEVVEVRDYGLDRVYEKGKDYTVEGRTLRLPAGSTIPFFRYDELYHDNPDAKPGVMKALGGGFLAFAESAFFNERQIAVTYRPAAGAWEGPVPASAAAQLPRTFDRLRGGGPLKVVVYGDSISFGASASAAAVRPPFLPRWSDLLAGELRRHYRAEIDMVNASLGGTNTGWGRKSAAGLVALEKPDLVILGFGMNDGAGVPVETFVENTRAMMDTVREANPAAEFVLLMSFQPNSRWRDFGPMPEYLAALRAMEGPGVALADLWSMHGYLLQHKDYADMTGNHVNHPNDFMVRVYAQVLAARLGVLP